MIAKYFGSVCGEQSVWEESNHRTIELKEDDPDAVEAMLRHLYGFKYSEIESTLKKGCDINFHINVIVAAQKYLLPTLLFAAQEALVREISNVESLCKDTGIGKEVLKAVQLLMDSQVFYTGFAAMAERLKTKHMAALFKIKDFRTSLETDEESKILMQLIGAVDLGHEVPQGVEENKEIMNMMFVKCVPCGMMWNFGKVIKCGNCGNDDRTKYVQTHPGSAI